ncbi:MAG: hypothetical protein LW860_17710, partial [Xanthomonadaceae bacterium]|nr:hypothetical protein [Xanthomonadaceae bacterium]
RRAAEAARDAWRGTPAAPAEPEPSTAPPDAATAPAAPEASPAAPVDAPAPAGGIDARQADFALVEPHAEAFIRAKALAAFGL